MSRFADIIGQEIAIKILLKAVKNNQVGQSWLFVGPEGVGKLTTALAFAAALNCSNQTESGDACGECASCRMILSLGHPDVQVISPDGAQTKIEQMRIMRRDTSYMPVVGQWKVVIIEQADTLNYEAAISILKTIEEPPDYLAVILLSRNPALILPTIRSRCRIVRFAGVPIEELAPELIKRFGISEPRAQFLASYSEGRPGTAISLIGNDSFFQWRDDITVFALKLSSAGLAHVPKLSEELLSLSENENGKKNQRLAVKETLDALILWYRDLLSLTVQGKDAQIINCDLRNTLNQVRISSEKAAGAIESLIWARRAVESNANVQLISDVVTARLVS